MSDFTPPAALPKAITDLPIWLVWKLVQKTGEPKPRKMPFYTSGNPRGWPKGRPKDGRKDDPEHPNVDQGTPLDRAAMSTYDRAVAACLKGGYTGIGLAPFADSGITALDFDNCVKNGVVEPRIAALVDSTYSEFSPSGNGIRAFMVGTLQSRKDNADKLDRNADGSRKDGLFDIEFFGHNGFVTVTGNVTPDTALLGLEQTAAPLTPDVRALYRQRFGDGGTAVALRRDATGADDDLLALDEDRLGWTIEEAREILFACDPDASREKWFFAIAAIHHELSAAPEGLELVDEWSQQSSKYGGRADVEGRWFSCSKGRSAVIGGNWLKAWRAECQAHEKYDATAEWKEALSKVSEEFPLREKLCPKIALDERLDSLAREALAQSLFDAFKRLGTKYPIGQCRKMIEPKREDKKTSGKIPKWVEGWVYVTDDDEFYRMDSDEWLSMQGFNATYNREMPRNSEGEISKSASATALEDYQINSVTRGQYLPWADQQFVLEGVKCVNLYRPSSVPEPVARLSDMGKRAVSIVMRHVTLLAGNRPEVVATLLDWMAFNVQQPGVKVRWAPLIKGVEGDGKTVMGSLLAAVMGRPNVKNVSPKVLATDFSGWAQGAAVIVLEEIKMTGHNRFDILNALKPNITNDMIEVHPKGKDSYDAINTSNYMAFTNFGDALPITDTDRRWMVIFTPWPDINALAAVLGRGDAGVVLGTYFDVLNDTIQQHRGELRRWLLDYPISAAFKPNGRAPMTEEKSVMVGMSVSEEERAVKDILEKGGTGISEAAFMSSYLSAAVMEQNADVNLATSALSRLLIKLGYTRQAKKLKWEGKTEIVWIKGHRFLDNKELRELLLGTCAATDLNEDLFEVEPKSADFHDLF